MIETIHFDLVSPEEKLVSKAVQMAVIPGVEGELGVGAGHASFVVALKPGIVTLMHQDGESAEQIYIAGGFADITGETCTVLAEEAVNVNDLNPESLQQELQNLEEDLSIADEQSDKDRIAKKILLTKSRIQAATGEIIS